MDRLKLTVLFFLEAIRCYNPLDPVDIRAFVSDCLLFLKYPFTAGIYNSCVDKVFINLYAHNYKDWSSDDNIYNLIDTITHESLHYVLFNNCDDSIDELDHETHEIIVEKLTE